MIVTMMIHNNKIKLTRVRVCEDAECNYHTFVMKRHYCRMCKSKLYTIAFEEPNIDVDREAMIRHNLELFYRK